MTELFFTATEKERESGYCKADNHYHCLLCDYRTEDGYIYPVGDIYADARKQMERHIEEAHGSVFDTLIVMDKKLNGVSEHQSKIMKMFYDGISDYEIQQALNIGSLSTVRNHRYMLKEKERQAKVLLTIMGLLNAMDDPKNTKVAPHTTATMVDDRYDVTIQESMEVIEKYFPDGIDGQLTTFYVKEKHKIIILCEIIKKFEEKRRYKEKEVDVILKKIYPDDHALIRRYLIQYGFMSREKDGSAYWVKDKNEPAAPKSAKSKKKAKKQPDKRKKELMKAYKAKAASETIEDGIYVIRNRTNDKVYVGASKDISRLQGLNFQLNTGSFPNRGLQKDWTELGEDSFVIEIVDRFERSGDSPSDNKTLREMERSWKEKLQPYGDKGYHRG